MRRGKGKKQKEDVYVDMYDLKYEMDCIRLPPLFPSFMNKGSSTRREREKEIKRHLCVCIIDLKEMKNGENQINKCPLFHV